MKCLDSNPNLRYTSAAALADDLDAWLNGQPVSVRPPSVVSAVGSVLLSNLRSAIGAGMIGLLAGLALAVTLGEGHKRSNLVNNPPSQIYSQLPATIHWGRNLFYFNESVDRQNGLVLVVMLFAVVTVGYLVTAVTRPQPGAASLAMGVVAALFMMTAAFVFQLGPMAFANRLSQDVLPRTRMVAEIAFGTEHQAADARKAIAAEFPTLKQLPADQQANTFAYRVFYDCFFRTPAAILGAFYIAGVFSVAPCILGTCFSSKLLHEHGNLFRALPGYLEFMFWVFVVTVTTFAFIVLNSGSSIAGIESRPAHWLQTMTLLVFGAITISLYKRWLNWPRRLFVYGGLIGVAALAATIVG